MRVTGNAGSPRSWTPAGTSDGDTTSTASTTAVGWLPIMQVLVGWKVVPPVLRTCSNQSSSLSVAAHGTSARMPLTGHHGARSRRMET